MKHLALALLLCSCSFYDGDSYEPMLDASLDSPTADAPSSPQGCAAMGNLPDARTLNVVAGDPVTAALLDELQDMVVGSNRPPIARRIFPSTWLGGTAVCVVNPNGVNDFLAWKLTTGSVYKTMIPFDVGDNIVGFSMEVFGDGAVDIADGAAVGTGLAFRSSYNAAGFSGAGSVTATNVPATWTTVTFTSVGIVGGLVSGMALALNISVSGGTFLHVGYLTPIFRR